MDHSVAVKRARADGSRGAGRGAEEKRGITGANGGSGSGVPLKVPGTSPEPRAFGTQPHQHSSIFGGVFWKDGWVIRTCREAARRND